MYRGLYELETNANDNFPNNCIRTVGGGRKSIIEKRPEFLAIFDEIASLHTAGLPQDEEVIWLTISTSKIVSMFKDRGIDISPYVVSQMKRIRGFKDHSFAKALTMKDTEGRNAQFEKSKGYVPNVHHWEFQY